MTNNLMEKKCEHCAGPITNTFGELDAKLYDLFGLVDVTCDYQNMTCHDHTFIRSDHRTWSPSQKLDDAIGIIEFISTYSPYSIMMHDLDEQGFRFSVILKTDFSIGTTDDAQHTSFGLTGLTQISFLHKMLEKLQIVISKGDVAIHQGSIEDIRRSSCRDANLINLVEWCEKEGHRMELTIC